MHVERIETRRMTLEPISLSHSTGMFDLWSNADVCRYSGPLHDYEGDPIPSPVRVVSDSDRLIDFWIRAGQEGWGMRWAMLERDSAEFVGSAGFNSLGRCAEYAYHLLPRYWHRGLMTEASQALFERVRNTGCLEVEAFIEPDNAPSIAFAERNGFTVTGAIAGKTVRFLKPLG